jgi:hypothetical protein
MWIKIGKWASLWIVALFCFSAWAEDVTFDATVNTNKVSLQDMVELTLSVHGAKGNVPIIPLPAIEGFDARFVGPATKFSIVNGESSSEHAFIYDLFPNKVGHYRIPSISVVIDGKTYTSSPIDIDVGDKPNAEGKESQNINEKVFMRAFIGSKDVYVGQRTPLTIKVFVKDLSLQLAGVPSLTPDGFVADPTANMQKGKEVLNGVSYDSLTFDTNIYPTKPGTVQVGPLVSQGELVYRIKKSDDILGDIFGNTETRPITLHAPAMTINVLPLPAEGRPQNFSGAVGQYDFKASVGPSLVKVGDPLTLRMTITGQGHLKDLTAPVFNDSRFKTYDPQVKVDDNSKTIEQVIIPTAQDITEVPPLSFSYFDPQEKKYKTITQGPFAVKVLAPSKEEEFKAYGFVDKTKQPSEKSLVVNGQRLKNWVQKSFDNGIKMLKDLRFWLCVLLAGIILFCFSMWKEFQRRLENDAAFARRWKADAKAKELLKSTQNYLQENNSKEFYRSAYKTINDYLADKMHVPLAGLNWPMMEAYLNEHSIDSSKLQMIKSLFERCDLVRFASVSVPRDQMAQDFLQLQELVAYLSKLLK